MASRGFRVFRFGSGFSRRLPVSVLPAADLLLAPGAISVHRSGLETAFFQPALDLVFGEADVRFNPQMRYESESNYLRVVTEFAKCFGKSPDKLGPNELRTYQAYLLTECKLTPGTVVNRVAALRFFFVKTLKRHQFRDFLPYPQDRRRLPTVLSREEVARLINAAGTLFRRTLLMTLYATGMRRSELARLKVS